jgi:hypothetical protein
MGNLAARVTATAGATGKPKERAFCRKANPAVSASYNPLKVGSVCVLAHLATVVARSQQMTNTITSDHNTSTLDSSTPNHGASGTDRLQQILRRQHAARRGMHLFCIALAIAVLMQIWSIGAAGAAAHIAG